MQCLKRKPAHAMKQVVLFFKWLLRTLPMSVNKKNYNIRIYWPNAHKVIWTPTEPATALAVLLKVSLTQTMISGSKTNIYRKLPRKTA